METREIIIANTRTQKRNVITTSATTLGELKSALSEAGIDYDDMTFTEGISKTQLLADDTLLPQNVMYHGQPTNNLVILLTNTKKNIASGGASRQEVYQLIKARGLQEAVKAHFGRNFTQVPTADLDAFVSQHSASAPASGDYAGDSYEDEKDYNEEHSADTSSAASCSLANIITSLDITSVEDTLFAHIAMLAYKGAVSASDIKALRNNLEFLLDNMSEPSSAPVLSVETSDGSITNDDVTDIISSLNL